MKPLARRVERRSPFVVERLPLLGRLYRAAYGPSTRMRQELAKLPLRLLVSMLYRAGFGGKGRATLPVAGKPTSVEFDLRNLQFASLFMADFDGGYESETYALLDLLVRPDSVFFDVGANWGYFSLALAAREGFTGKVHAFEPMPGAYRDLTTLVEAAGLGGMITSHNAGLSHRDGEASMTLPDGMHSGLAKIAASGGTRVTLKRLDGLSLPKPDVMKLDVEDHELEALAGAEATLARAKPFVVFESAWGRQTPKKALAPFELLAGLGYAFFHPMWAGATELSAVPFEPQQRGLLKPQLNVLACHASRLTELESLFT